MSDPIGAREFLSVIWGEREGVAELTYIADKTISFGFTYPISLDAVITSAKNHSGKVNSYFGVCLRKPGTRIGFYDEKGHRGKEVDALSSTCVWADIDFKVVPEEEVRKLLKEFPLKPSIVVKSGGGVHVYWLLKKISEGDELKKVKDVNRALHGFLKCDKQTVDLARVLRIPNTLNVKYAPHRPCEVSWWKPELRYALNDFDRILVVEKEKAATAEKTQEQHAPELPDEIRQKIELLLRELWIEGWRHRMALYIAGVFAHAGFGEATAKSVVTNVSNAADGDTDKRLKDVEDTYRNFKEQKKVGGAGLLEKMVREEFPPLVNGNAVKIYTEVLRHIKKAKKAHETIANFKISDIVKFDSRPAKWKVSLAVDGGDIVHVEVGKIDLMSPSLFQAAAFEQTNKMIVAMTKPKWLKEINAAPLEVQPAPKEATPEGALGLALSEFLEGKKENADLGILRVLPGYDDKELYFRYSAFRNDLKERGLKIEDQHVYQFLKCSGWLSGAKRVTGKPTHVWTKDHLNGNAPSNGNWHVKNEKITPQLELPLPEVQPEGSNEF